MQIAINLVISKGSLKFGSTCDGSAKPALPPTRNSHNFNSILSLEVCFMFVNFSRKLKEKS